MKKFFKHFEIHFVIFFASLAFGLLVSVLCNIPLKFIEGININIGNFVTGIIGTISILFFLSFKEGYRFREFEFKITFLSILSLFVLQFILVAIFGHAVYISGSTVYLARYVLYLVNPELINEKEMLENYRLLFMILADFVVYLPVISFGEFLGAKKHKKDFSK